MAWCAKRSRGLTRPYRIAYAVLTFILMLVGVSTPSNAQVSPDSGLNFELGTIIIDAGHGGKDPGAVNRWGVREKDVVLAVAKRLREYLAAHAPDTQIVMIREDDEFLALPDRTDAANAAVNAGPHTAGAGQTNGIFVSLHCNASSNAEARGAEVYVYKIEATGRRAMHAARRENLGGDFSLDFIFADLRKRATAPYAEWLAHRIDGNLSKVDTLEGSRVEGGPFFVLFFTTMPAVLVELGFLTNEQEQRALVTDVHQNRLAAAIGNAIVRFGEEMLGPDESSWTAVRDADPAVTVDEP